MDEHDEIAVSKEFKPKILQILKDSNYTADNNYLLQIPYFSLVDYLIYLKYVCDAVSKLQTRAIIYSSAAVSDFYLPVEDMAEHKIQSRDGPLTIKLKPVPKVIKIMKKVWCSNAFVVTFKLETDPNLLEKKSLSHLDKNNYGVQCVVGNLLGEHQNRVRLYSENSCQVFERTEAQKERDDDIEDSLVQSIIALHSKYIQMSE